MAAELFTDDGGGGGGGTGGGGGGGNGLAFIDDGDGDPIAAYRQSLAELVLNSKPHILMLTMLAEDYKDSKADEIVDCIEQRLYQVSPDKKLPTLYLVDSICKNLPQSPYVEFFQRKIIKLFCNTFDKADDKTRLLLYKLRQTWNDIFRPEVLYSLDLSVKKLDPAWPIAKPAGGSAATATATAASSSETNIKDNVINKSASIKGNNYSTTTTTTLEQRGGSVPPPPPPSSSSSSSSSSHLNNNNNKSIGQQQPQDNTMVNGFNGGNVQVVLMTQHHRGDESKSNKISFSVGANSGAAATGGGPSGGNFHPQGMKKFKFEKRKLIDSTGGNLPQTLPPPLKNRKNDLNEMKNNPLAKNASNNFRQENINNKSGKRGDGGGKRKRKGSQSSMGGGTSTVSSGGVGGQLSQHVLPPPPPSSSATLLSKSNNQNKKHKEMDLLPPMPPAPDDVIPLGRDHHVSVTKRSKLEPRSHRNDSVVAERIKNRRRSRSPPSSSLSSSSLVMAPVTSAGLVNRSTRQSSINNHHDPVGGVKKPATVQTNIPAPNIFDQPEMLYAYPKMSDSVVSQANNNQNSNNNTNVGYGMDRDYRQTFESMPNEPLSGMDCAGGGGGGGGGDHHRFEMETFAPNQFMPNATIPPPGAALPGSVPGIVTSAPVSRQPPPPPVPVPVPNPVPYQHTSIVEPHGSMVLLINQSPRRLFYLDNATAIVLKAHPDTPFPHLITCDPLQLEPKQIYFAGNSTTVYIDRHQPFEQSLRLEFNERTPTTFYIPHNNMHIPQQIQLGLPARELFINGRPYQANFCGPPIQVYLECDNKYHTFELITEPPPVLQFSPECRYDLWHKLVQEAKLKAGIPPPPPPTQQSAPAGTAAPAVVPSAVPSTVPFNYGPPPPGQFNTVPPPSLPPPPVVASVQPQVPVPIAPVPVLPAALPVSTTAGQQQPQPVMPDLNKLLSKLTAAGLITTNPNTTISSSATTATISATSSLSIKNEQQQQQQTDINNHKVKELQYLPLEASSLKGTHEFVYQQMYSGVQCTNCSLRFSDDTNTMMQQQQQEDDKTMATKKSRYSRHLDWHFRQNRRKKTKPSSGISSKGKGSSSSTASAFNAEVGRRAWYYSTELWILYKEVNDDVEEDSSAGFFDGTTVNSPSMLAANTMANFDYSPYKDYIIDFDLFIESISCDTSALTTSNESSSSGGGDQPKKQCSVLADSDMTANNCAICNEAFDLKWHEEEEEWRLMNAVRYQPPIDDGGENSGNIGIGGIYHPLCLKDHLVQQTQCNNQAEQDVTMKSYSIPGLDSTLDMEDEEQHQQQHQMTPPTNRKKKVELIPGLDCGDELNSEELNDEDNNNNDSMMQQQQQNDLLSSVKIENNSTNNNSIACDGDEEQHMLTDDDGNGETHITIKQEDIEVKVEEFEIPLATSSVPVVIKNESTTELDIVRNISATTTTATTATTISNGGNSGGCGGSNSGGGGDQQCMSPAGEKESNIGAQPKRGGIVIKMKSASSNNTNNNLAVNSSSSSSSLSSSSFITTPEKQQMLTRSESGNVSSSSTACASDESGESSAGGVNGGESQLNSAMVVVTTTIEYDNKGDAAQSDHPASSSSALEDTEDTKDDNDDDEQQEQEKEKDNDDDHEGFPPSALIMGGDDELTTTAPSTTKPLDGGGLPPPVFEQVAAFNNNEDSQQPFLGASSSSSSISASTSSMSDHVVGGGGNETMTTTTTTTSLASECAVVVGSVVAVVDDQQHSSCGGGGDLDASDRSESSKNNNDDQPPSNYHSRGHEVSSLCAIM